MNTHDAALLRGRAAAACLMLSPVVLALGLLTVPGTSESHFDNFPGNEGKAQLSAALLHWGWVLLVPAVVALVPLLRGKASLIGHIAGGLAVIGLINWSSFLLGDFFDLALIANVDRATAETVSEATTSYPGAVFSFLLPGSLFTAVGLIGLFIALAASRRVSWLCPPGVVVGIALLLGLSQQAPALRLIGPFILLAALSQAAQALLAERSDDLVVAE